MGMSRSGWNRLTSRPAECLSLTIDWRNDLCLVGAQVVPRYFCSDAPRVFGVGQASRRRSTGSRPPASCAVGSRCSEGASVLREQSVELGLGLARAAGRDPVAALLAFVATL